MTGPLFCLASRSPRRRQLLRQLDLLFEVLDVEVDEGLREGEKPTNFVQRLALAKASAGQLQAAVRGRPVLGSDTAVIHAGRILGKPRDADEAAGILSELSGRGHEVLTAVACIQGANAELRLSRTRVRFRSLSGQEIQRYVASEEPLDKAGAYGIQGRGGAFVEHLDGSYSGVMGLPLYETGQLLADFGVDISSRWAQP